MDPDAPALFSSARLLGGARNAADPATQALAGVLEAIQCGRIDPPGAVMGLAAEDFDDLMRRYFPGIAAGFARRFIPAVSPAWRRDEFDDLLQLLLDDRVDDSDMTRWVAHATASGCMGHDHLYSDMGFSDRYGLTRLLRAHFPALYDKNPGGMMKWKKFFYRQLCLRAEISLCPAPGCQHCIDRDTCFIASAVAEAFPDVHAD